MIATILLMILGLAFFHLFYESVVAPSLRLKLRYELFRLRDRARLLKVDRDRIVDDAVCRTLEEYLNTAIKLLPRIDIRLIAEARIAFQADPSLGAQAEKRFRVLERCPAEQVRSTRTRAAELCAQALLVNSGGWFVYLIPVALVILTFHRITTLLRALLSLPGNRVDRVFPEAIV